MTGEHRIATDKLGRQYPIWRKRLVDTNKYAGGFMQYHNGTVLEKLRGWLNDNG
jgi:hypothetical protein